MDKLPVEIIENILKCSKLSIEDVVNFSSTNRFCRNVVLNNKSIWKQKFCDKWPDFIELFDKNFNSYYEEMRYIYDFNLEVLARLEKMPARFYKKYELSDLDLEEWSSLLNTRPQHYYYLVLELRTIVNSDVPIKSIEVVPLKTPGNKTLQYYANKVLRYIQQLHLAKVWRSFIKLPRNEQILEKGAVFVAEWSQPHLGITYKKIAKQLDDIANEVRNRLLIINPNHTLFKTDPEIVAKWHVENLKKNQWNVSESRQVIVAMRDVLYTQMEFTGDNIAYYMPQNSFINEVLQKKRGLPITLAVVYESIARRLGLLCEPISFPAHFLLRFTESNNITNSDCYYIDVFNGGNIVRKGSCPHNRFAAQRELFPVASAMQVVERMAINLEVSARQHTQPNGRITRLRSSLELLQLVNPQDLTYLISLARLYMLHSMDTRPLENFLLSQEFDVPEQAQRVVHMLRDYGAHHENNHTELTNHVVNRTSNVTYAVGMLMKHSILKYKCVIYDWDPIYLSSSNLQAEMNFDKLLLKNKQPFYSVLVEDGSYRYVAQENLVPTTELGFLYLNEDIGRYFSHFFGTHYVPNIEKEQEYPTDKEVRFKFYQDALMNTYSLN